MRYDPKLIEGILLRDIVKARKSYTRGRKIRVIKVDEFGELKKETYEVTNTFPPVAGNSERSAFGTRPAAGDRRGNP